MEREKQELVVADSKFLVTIFGSREKANRGSAVQVRRDVANLRKTLKKNLEREGADDHDAGTGLAILYMTRADEIFGYASFLRFAKKELGLSRAVVYRLARVARYATASQAKWGTEACIQAASMVDLFAANESLRRAHGLASIPKTITDIAKLELQVAGGRIRLVDAPGAPAIEEALDELRAQTNPGERRLPAGLRAKNVALRRGLAADPDLLGVGAKFVMRNGRKKLDLSIPEGASLTRIARALERVLGAL